MTKPGDIVFLDQPVPAYYRRIVVPTDGAVEWSDCKAYLIDGEPRQGYLAQFLSATKSYELFHPRTTIDWHGNAEEAVGEIAKKLDESKCCRVDSGADCGGAESRRAEGVGNAAQDQRQGAGCAPRPRCAAAGSGVAGDYGSVGSYTEESAEKLLCSDVLSFWWGRSGDPPHFSLGTRFISEVRATTPGLFDLHLAVERIFADPVEAAAC